MEVEKIGEDTLVSDIVRLLDRAQSEKPAMARLADQVAAWFVGALLVLAAVVAWWWWQIEPERAFSVTLSLLVVTCPCALSLATPTALTAATSSLTRMGLLTTRGHALETLAKATRMVFDKTGTLTLGRLKLSGMETSGLDRDRALAIAAALDRASEHPVARILVAAGDAGLRADGVRATPGQGMEGRVEGRRYRVGNAAYVAELGGRAAPPESGTGTRVVLGDESGWLAWFELEDEVRSEAGNVVQQLEALGVEVELLSGDARGVVTRVAGTLGIERYQGEARPWEKLSYIQELQAQGEIVAMVGDGVNDAPVLAAAQISLAMGGGAQLAHASADMVLLSERLSHLVDGLRMARRTRKVIRQNLAWAVMYNLLAVPLAAAGMVPPWAAALGMSLSSLVVVINALRLRAARPEAGSPPVALATGAQA
jgi:Cu2+-exporting ATPase